MPQFCNYFVITLCSQFPLPSTLGLPQRQINIELFQTMVDKIGWQSKQLLFRVKKCLNKIGRFCFLFLLWTIIIILGLWSFEMGLCFYPRMWWIVGSWYDKCVLREKYKNVHNNVSIWAISQPAIEWKNLFYVSHLNVQILAFIKNIVLFNLKMKNVA